MALHTEDGRSWGVLSTSLPQKRPLRLGHLGRDGTLRATPLADPCCGEGGGGQGSAGGCMASRVRPHLHWSARGYAGLGVCDEVGGARAHLEVPWAGRSRDTHSSQSVSPSQPPLFRPRGRRLRAPLPLGAQAGWGGGGVEWWMGLLVHSLARGAHLFGRGGPPARLPCGSQIPTYSPFGVRPLSARGGTSITMRRLAVRVRGHA